ncbi:MAG: TetR/AcrR family transcriptional regulator [Deltaproteobacteria bacterium]|nr:TetR/AcrR family transcriptional regulator [Deltaproteobacteria bacterium]
MTDGIRHQFEEMEKRLSGGTEVSGTAVDSELTDLKHQLIVEGASKVLFEKGFHGASMREIAAACGMSFGQLYHYISSKDDILYLIHKHSQDLWYQRLKDAEFETIKDPVARLAHALRLSTEFVYENRKMYLFLYTESKYLEREHLKRVLEMDDKNVVGFYRHLLSEIPQIRLAGNEAEVAANLIPFISVFLALRGWNLDLTRFPEHVEFLVEFVFRGLGLDLPAGAGKLPEKEPSRP